MQVLTPLAVLSTLQRSSTLTLDVAKTFFQKYVSRQQSNAAQNMAKITQLQKETSELAERVRTKRSQPLVRAPVTTCGLAPPMWFLLDGLEPFTVR
jgi:hypothetical protein